MTKRHDYNASLSARTRTLLAFLQQWPQPYQPTREEIRAALHWSSKSLVQYHLVVLMHHGYLILLPKTPRGIRLIDQWPFTPPIAKAPTVYPSDPTGGYWVTTFTPVSTLQYLGHLGHSLHLLYTTKCKVVVILLRIFSCLAQFRSWRVPFTGR